MNEDDQRSRYQPRPIDTSGVVVPDHLRELSETLAENAHEVWAAQRISDGWQYGPSRDDDAKHHPCRCPTTGSQNRRRIMTGAWSIKPCAAS